MQRLRPCKCFSHGGSRRFESCCAHHKNQSVAQFSVTFSYSSRLLNYSKHGVWTPLQFSRLAPRRRYLLKGRRSREWRYRPLPKVWTERVVARQISLLQFGLANKSPECSDWWRDASTPEQPLHSLPGQSEATSRYAEGYAIRWSCECLLPVE